MSCEQNEPVRCVLRLFGASALGVQQAASAFPPEWCVTAQCRSRGAETLIALRSENAAGLDKARRSLHGCFAADLYGEGDTDLAAAVVQALEHRRRLLVCADAAAGALMEARLEAVPGAEKVFDFWHPELCRPQGGGTDRPPGCPQAGRCRRIGPGTGGTAPCGGRSCPLGAGSRTGNFCCCWAPARAAGCAPCTGRMGRAFGCWI